MAQIYYGRIYTCVRPFNERPVSNLDRSMNRSLWAYIAHSSFIEGSHTTKNTASVSQLLSEDTQKSLLNYKKCKNSISAFTKSLSLSKMEILIIFCRKYANTNWSD